MVAPTVAPHVQSEGAEHSIWYSGGPMTLLATSADTRGYSSLFDCQAERGGEPLLHTHTNEHDYGAGLLR